MNDVAAVVVTFNRLEKLKQCIQSLLEQSYACDILVIDNASSDGTKDYLNSISGDNISFYRLKENIGGAGGFNYGMRKAAELGYRYIWTMDDDCYPSKDALKEFITADAILGGPGEYGFLSSAVLWTDGHECRMNRQLVSKQFYQSIEYIQYGIIKIWQATFVSLLIPVSTVQKFGLPYKEFFIWGDDIEYTRRIAMRGNVNSYLAGRSRVVHAMDNNVGSDLSDDVPERIDRYRLSVRNECFTYSKQGIKGHCLYLYRCMRSFCRICRNAPDRKMQRIAALFAGMIQGVFFRPETEYLNFEDTV